MTDQNPVPVPTEYVNKIAVKLPDFWTEDLDLWFMHAESAFKKLSHHEVTDKFDHVIQKLPQAIIVSVLGSLGTQ